jgi:hypothetical protein
MLRPFPCDFTFLDQTQKPRSTKKVPAKYALLRVFVRTSIGCLVSLSRQLHPLRCKRQPSVAIEQADSPLGFDPAFGCCLAALFAIELSHGVVTTRIPRSGSV